MLEYQTKQGTDGGETMGMIDREAAINAIVAKTIYKSREEIGRHCQYPINDNGWIGGINAAINAIEDIPEPTAHNIEKYKSLFDCSNCGYVCNDTLCNEPYKFCPGCGLKLEVAR